MFNKQVKLRLLLTSLLFFLCSFIYANEIPKVEREAEEKKIAALLKNKSNEELLLLLKDKDLSLAREASKILGKRKDKSVVPTLLKLLESESEYVKSLACLSLGEIGSKEAVKPLMKLVKEAKTKGEKVAPLIALCKISDPRAYNLIESEIDDVAYGPRVYNPVFGELQDAYLEMKIKGLGEEEKLKTLIEILKERKIGFIVKEEIVKVGQKAVPDLIKVLEDKKNKFSSRLDAMWCLAGIKDERRIKPIINVLLDESETDHLRESAAYILGVIKDKSAIPALEKVIKTWKPKPNAKVITVIKTGEKIYANDVKRAAEKALEQIKSQEKIKDKKEEK